MGKNRRAQEFSREASGRTSMDLRGVAIAIVSLFAVACAEEPTDDGIGEGGYERGSCMERAYIAEEVCGDVHRQYKETREGPSHLDCFIDNDVGSTPEDWESVDREILMQVQEAFVCLAEGLSDEDCFETYPLAASCEG